MAGPLQIERAGRWFHATGLGNERRAIYRDDRDCQHFVALLAATTGQFRLRLRGAVSIAVRRLEKRLRRNTTERDQFQRLYQLLNVEM